MNLKTIIKSPIVTEKSLTGNQLNRYSFKVDPKATKHQIKHAVQTLFSVNVTKVNTLINKGIARRTGRRRLPTTTSTIKKAVVTLKAGQSIKSLEMKG
jgi:large subunit ribosomal protein L23